MVRYIIPENQFDLSIFIVHAVILIEILNAWETVNSWGWREFVMMLFII